SLVIDPGGAVPGVQPLTHAAAQDVGDRAITFISRRVSETGIGADAGVPADDRAPQYLLEVGFRHPVPGPLEAHLAGVNGPELLAVWDQEGVSKSAADRLVYPVGVIGRLGVGLGAQEGPDAVEPPIDPQIGRIDLERV